MKNNPEKILFRRLMTRILFSSSIIYPQAVKKRRPKYRKGKLQLELWIIRCCNLASYTNKPVNSWVFFLLTLLIKQLIVIELKLACPRFWLARIELGHNSIIFTYTTRW